MTDHNDLNSIQTDLAPPCLSEVCSRQQRGQLCGLQHPRSFLQCHDSMQAGAHFSGYLVHPKALRPDFDVG